MPVSERAGSRHPQTRNQPTPSRGKRLRGSPTSPPAPEEPGGSDLLLDALDPDHHELEYREISSQLAGPVSQSYFYHPGETQVEPHHPTSVKPRKKPLG